VKAMRKKTSKLMELVVYIALKSNQQVTFSELVKEFVVKRGWSRNTLTKYLSLLHQRGVITRSWLKYTDDKGRERRFRIYRLNPEYNKR
jgi:predicted AAA+ superfamily ATPase